MLKKYVVEFTADAKVASTLFDLIMENTSNMSFVMTDPEEVRVEPASETREKRHRRVPNTSTTTEILKLCRIMPEVPRARIRQVFERFGYSASSVHASISKLVCVKAVEVTPSGAVKLISKKTDQQIQRDVQEYNRQHHKSSA